MMRAVLCAALVFAASPVRAQKVTLDQALALAEAEHPLLKASVARLDASTAAIDTARWPKSISLPGVLRLLFVPSPSCP